MEDIVLNILVPAGDARSNSLMAIKAAIRKDFCEADELLKRGKESLHSAHGAQTSLIQQEAAGVKSEVSLIMVHAQDHLMTSIAIKDIAELFVQTLKQQNEEIEQLKKEVCKFEKDTVSV